MNVAILVPVCSRNQTYESIDDIPLLKNLYPSFLKTKEEYNYKFFIGYDDDDLFYIENSKKLNFDSYALSGCQHAPATAWNKLAEIAFKDEIKFNYFFQVGDDVILEKGRWTSHFIKRLQDNGNIGVVGPCNLVNYTQRKNAGRPYVIENAFVSRNHIEIFGYFFHPSIKNWYCDDWITQVYSNIFSEIQVEYTCRNTIIDKRYSVAGCPQIKQLVAEGFNRINNRRAFSYCVYGSNEKYCLGMVKNLEQINQLFPAYQTWIYLGNDVPQEYVDQYKSYQNVTLIYNDFTGGRLMAHRYFILANAFDFIFVRDADSRFGERDLWCIQNFMKSPFKIFTIRDHRLHGKELMGGQTGFKNFTVSNILDCYDEFSNKRSNIDNYQSDQDFIIQYIFNNYKHDTIAYSNFYNFGEAITLEIPLARKSDEDFCGNVYLFDKEAEYAQFTIHGHKSR